MQKQGWVKSKEIKNKKDKDMGREEDSIWTGTITSSSITHGRTYQKKQPNSGLPGPLPDKTPTLDTLASNILSMSRQNIMFTSGHQLAQMADKEILDA